MLDSKEEMTTLMVSLILINNNYLFYSYAYSYIKYQYLLNYSFNRFYQVTTILVSHHKMMHNELLNFLMKSSP